MALYMQIRSSYYLAHDVAKLRGMQISTIFRRALHQSSLPEIPNALHYQLPNPVLPGLGVLLS